ncbi:molybdopterin-dependent oxidoreductase [Glaciimonas sp. CA11.2]|nr:molybdopterin cofactor-binding domain-containing protein [Glaciimonas sp. CA11.2]MDY7548251.1 molybdopterin-dependent oxidoreductase [Glaciimonas sp. CA11.2]MEB0165405.1 molybdopterin-dependent oxidoreductase [Glaciimonas sp. CA11.2]
MRVICPYVGGRFGGIGSTWFHVVPAAMVARQLGQPVKLALKRPQMFGPVLHRPNTEQRFMLAANIGARFDRATNLNLAEYNVPVNADVRSINIIAVDENDPHINSLGA